MKASAVLWKCNLDPNTKTGQLLHAFDTKMLRRIYGQIQVKRYWHPRWNSKIYNIHNYINIVDDIKIRKLGWVGCIIRMEVERIPSKSS